MCWKLRKGYFKKILKLVVPFGNRVANLRLADWPANLQTGQICILDGIYILEHTSKLSAVRKSAQ